MICPSKLILWWNIVGWKKVECKNIDNDLTNNLISWCWQLTKVILNLITS